MITTLVGLIRNKLLAINLGPTGMGVFAQLFGVQALAAGLVPMGMQTEALRFVAKHRSEDPVAVARFVSTASKVFLLTSSATVLLCFIFLKPLSLWALHTTRYMLFLVPPIIGVLFLVQSQLWLAYIQAGLDVKMYSKAQVTTAILGLTVLVPIVLVWNLKGAAVHLLIFAAVGYIVTRIFVKRSMSAEMAANLKGAAFDLSAVTSMARFGFANIPVSIFALLIPFIVRTQIVKHIGLHANGIYQAVFAISNQYVMVALMAMQTYAFPNISRLADDVRDVNTQVNNAIKAVLLFSTAGILAILLARDLVVNVLFSKEFSPAVGLLPLQMVGDFIRCVGFTVQLPLLAQKRLLARVVLATLQSAAFLGVFFVTPPHNRLYGAVLAHVAAWSVLLLSSYIYMSKTNGYRFTPDNVRLIACGLAAVSLVAFLPIQEPMWRLIAIGTTLAWGATALTKHERNQIRETIATRLADTDKSEEPKIIE